MKPFSDLSSAVTRRGVLLGATGILGGVALSSLGGNAASAVATDLPALFDVLPQASSGRVTLGQGVHAPQATRALQDALRINWRAKFLNYSSTGTFGHLTKMALMNWQMAAQYPATGTIRTGTDQWNLLMRERLTDANIKYQTRYVAHFPKLSKNEIRGRAAYVSLTDLRLYLVLNGRVQASYPIRVGGPSTPTPVGKHRVQYKVLNDVSRELGNAPMPRSLYFTLRGHAIHKSGYEKIRSGFEVEGYSTQSNGCVNIRTIKEATEIYNWLPWNSLVVVYYGGRVVGNYNRF